MSAVWGAWAPDWSLYDKVDFDGINKIIYVHPEVTSLDIRNDVYTSWVDWIALRDNLKFMPAIRTTGLDPIGGGAYTGDVYFLINGWKLSVDISRVKVNGVLYSDDYDTAYYTTNLTPQYPATVSALVNTIAPVVSVDGLVVPTAEETAGAVWNATVRTLTSDSGVTLQQIEGSTVLAKQSNLISIQNSINSLPSAPSVGQIADAVRTELTSELAHLMTLENNPGMTSGQATMLLELYRLAGLDPTRPLIVTQSQRNAGEITQNISSSSTETIINRV